MFFKLNAIVAAQSFHITEKSANVKTGPIPVTTSTRASCSPTCKFFDNGCYAETGPLRLHWNAVTADQRGVDFTLFCETVAAMPDDTFWRHNQAGDLPHIGGVIDAGAMHMLIEANQGKKGFTYTHHDIGAGHNLHLIELANVCGFTVNLSANDLDHADELAETGLPVAVVLPILQMANTTTPAGRKVVICPAITRDDVSCATCQLCGKADRSVIIGFPSHGTGAKKADAVSRRVINLKVAA
jgi:hypothetical protein